MVSSQHFTSNYASHVKHLLKLFKDLSVQYKEMTNVLSDLGGCYNGYSISLPPTQYIEKIGEAFDAYHTLHQSDTPGLGQSAIGHFGEYHGYAIAIQGMLKCVSRKQIQHDTFDDLVEAKKTRLGKIEASEEESLRIGVVLQSEGVFNQPVGLLGKLNAYIDRDPEATRRKSMSQLREDVGKGDSEVDKSALEMKLMKDEVMEQLGEFQVLKEKDALNFWREYAEGMREYHGKIRDIWSNCLTSEELN